MGDPLFGLLAVALAFVFGWNNSSFFIGNTRASGVLSHRQILVVASLGLLLGVLVEGSKMSRSLVGSLSPLASAQALEVTMSVSTMTTVAFSLMNLPISFSSAIVGAFIGVVVQSGSQLNEGRLLLVTLFWLLAPLLTAAITLPIHRGIVSTSAMLNLTAVDTLNRLGLIVSSFAAAYVLGANNIGLIYSVYSGGTLPGDPMIGLVGLTAASISGMVLLGSKGVSGTTGDKLVSLSPQGVLAAFVGSSILVWAGTQLGLPISMSQCLLGGMLGATFAKKVRVLNNRLALESVMSWLVLPILALVLAYVMSIIWP